MLSDYSRLLHRNFVHSHIHDQPLRQRPQKSNLCHTVVPISAILHADLAVLFACRRKFFIWRMTGWFFQMSFLEKETLRPSTPFCSDVSWNDYVLCLSTESGGLPKNF